MDRFSDAEVQEEEARPARVSTGSGDSDMPEMSSDEDERPKSKSVRSSTTTKRKPNSAKPENEDNNSVDSDDLMAFLSDSDAESAAGDSPSGRGNRRQSVKERVDAILAPRVRPHAQVLRAEESRSAARKLSVLDTDVGDFRSALIDALSSKPVKRVVIHSPPKQPDRSAVIVKKNEFHLSLQHSEHVVRKQLVTALKKIQVQSRENEILLRRLDNSESLEAFEKLRRQLEEQERTIERLEMDNKHLQLVQRSQERLLLDASKEMHEENDSDATAQAEVRSLTARLSSMRAMLEETRARERSTGRRFEQLRKKYKKLNRKHNKLKADHSVITSREDSLYTITEGSETGGQPLSLEGGSLFAASTDDIDARVDLHSAADMSLLEEEKSKWELQMKSMRKNVASQRSVYVSELSLLKNELQNSEKLRQDAVDELVAREKQARVQVRI